MSAQVTAMGIRDGDPAVLEALVHRRGAAVLAFCETACAPSLALDAAADAFTRFRAAVLASPRPTELDPEAALLSSTRYAAAARTPRPPAQAATGLSRMFGGRGPGDRLPEVPDLLAARAEGTLTEADADALENMLDSSPVARSIEARFEAAEEAYRSAPREPLPPPLAGPIVATMAALAAAPPPPDDDLELPEIPVEEGAPPRFFRAPAPPADPFTIPPPPPIASDPFAMPGADGAPTRDAGETLEWSPPPFDPTEPDPTAAAPTPAAEDEDAPETIDEPVPVADEDEPDTAEEPPPAPAAEDEDEPDAAEEPPPAPAAEDKDEPDAAEEPPATPAADEDEPEAAEEPAAAPAAEDEDEPEAEADVEAEPAGDDDEGPAPEQTEPAEDHDEVEAEPVSVDEAVPDSAEIAATRADEAEPSRTVEWSVPDDELGDDPEIEREIAAARLSDPGTEEDPGHLQSASGALAEEDVSPPSPEDDEPAPPAPGAADDDVEPQPPAGGPTAGAERDPQPPLHRRHVGRAALAPAAAVVAIAAFGAMAASGVFGGNDDSPPVDTGIVPERALQAVPEGEAQAIVDDLRSSADEARRRRLADLRQQLAARQPITPPDPTPPSETATGPATTDTTAPGAGTTVTTGPGDPLVAAAAPLDADILAIGRELAAAFPKASRRPLKALDDKAMDLASSDAELKAALFRFVDVVPACRSLDDLARHLTSFLDEVDEKPPPLQVAMRMAGSATGRRALGAASAAGVRHMAHRFIVGETPKDALPVLKGLWKRGIRTSVDLLGEATVTQAEADRYAARCADALDELAAHDPDANLSVKVSALTPLLRPDAPERGKADAGPRLRELLRRARRLNAHLHIDMESLDSREAITDLVLELLAEDEFRDGPSTGMVLQAYLRDSDELLDRILAFVATVDRAHPLVVRLVKGAYWDHEVVEARQHGWSSPVFEEKAESDRTFEHLTRRLLDARDQGIAPAIASHNLRSVSHAIAYNRRAGAPDAAVEYQVLRGLGDDLQDALAARGFKVRTYCPVGDLVAGMAYLVRRLLENTSNEGFLEQVHSGTPLEELLAAP